MRLDQGKAKLIFNAIAVIYALLDGMVKNFFKKAAKETAAHVELHGQSVLDIGSGTGAWSALLQERGAGEVVGVDFARTMVYVARKRYGKTIRFDYCDAEKLSKFADNSFDVVTSSYVLHGMKQEQRELVLQQMQRVARKHIVIHDYSQNLANIVMLFLEVLEGSDYFHFYKRFAPEFQNLFPNSQIIDITRSNALYIAHLRPSP
jgi:ubiquinone/menaquinone biosynthesis C-methylase UbiE